MESLPFSAMILATTVTLLLFFCGQSAGVFEPQDTTCGLEYQSTIMEAIEMRKQCNNAAFRDCCQIMELNPASISNAYEVYHVCTSNPVNFGVTKIYASCDMETDGGGWMTIMQRKNGVENFNRSIETYEFGFGNLDGDFWYGLKNIHCLTSREEVELRIEIGNGTVPSIVWVYKTFKVGPEPAFILNIGEGEGEGDSNDAMKNHDGKIFYTYDRDLSSCARANGGGWWYINNGNCHTANLNGQYASDAGDGLTWSTTAGYVHFTHVTMKVRPKSCTPCREFVAKS